MNQKTENTVIGPLDEGGHIQGRVISVCADSNPRTVTLEEEPGRNAEIQIATEEMFDQLAELMGEPVRIHGAGTWLRDEHGNWQMLKFVAATYKVLEDSTAEELIGELREAGKDSDWAKMDDPIGFALDLRKD